MRDVEGRTKMSERTDSQIIHEAMELLWHKEVHRTDCDCEGECKYESVRCSCDLQVRPCDIDFHCQYNNITDYTDPTSYLEAMTWAKRQDWWFEFYRGWLTIDMLLNPKQGSHALAKFLEGREE